MTTKLVTLWKRHNFERYQNACDSSHSASGIFSEHNSGVKKSWKFEGFTLKVVPFREAEIVEVVSYRPNDGTQQHVDKNVTDLIDGGSCFPGLLHNKINKQVIWKKMFVQK